MFTIPQAKSLARALAGRSDLTHSQALEAVAQTSGFRDWNTFVAVAGDAAAAEPVGTVASVVPVLRVFDHGLAREFYCDFLGFTWQWEHRFEPDLPVYAQVGREGAVLHLSEHHGDATPGSAVRIRVEGLDDYQSRLLAARHSNARPGIEDNPWGREMTITDPFGNRLVFWEESHSDRG